MTHPLFKNSFRISERQLQDGLTKADKHLLIQILHFFPGDDDIVESFDALQVGSPCVLQAESFH